MIQIKKTILTLALLLTAVTGAWAEDDVKLTTTEIVPPAAWNNDNSDLLPSDMPGLKADAITKEQAEAWADVPKTGWVVLIYGYEDTGNWIDYNIINFYDGQVDYTNQERVSHNNVYYYADTGIKKYYYATASSASSGPKVTWNTAEKTGQFTMPGGNVELEPEYYPQAAFATGGAPTAINDVPATTDGAIVNAGTVANIDGTTTAQGTVMYYAVQSATAPTAPDYDATGWTDKVPTATDFDEGNVYVWYYVKGADGDETSTFSDGDITKLGESGYITLLAAPTYAVTFAEGVNPEPPAEPEWTASPNADVTKGDKVTVTYSGSKKVIGVKAEKKAAAPAEGKTYTNLQGGEVLHVGDKITETGGKFRSTHHENPTSTDYISLMFSNTTYEVLRADVALSGYKYEYTESPNGQYYVIKYTYYDDEDEKWVTSYFFTQDLPVTGTSDGITVTLDGQDGNQRNMYTFWVHEPNQ